MIQNKLVILSLKEDLNCVICWSVLKVPRQCKNGHLFCLECIQNSLKLHLECPTCKIPLSEDTLSVNLFVKNFIDSSTSSCISNFDNCETSMKGDEYHCRWSGSFAHQEWHFTNECMNRLVNCHNTNCKVRLKSFKLAYHQTICEFRRISCPHCKFEMSYGGLQSHFLECLYVPVKCTQGCEKELARCSLENHFKTECLNYPITCPLFEASGCYDCTGLVARGDCESHCSAPVRTTAIIVKLSGRIASLEQQSQGPTTTATHLDNSADITPAISPPMPVPPIIPEANLGSKIEYRNKKSKWIPAWVIACDLTTIKSYIVQNAYGLQLSVRCDDLRLVVGSKVIISTDNKSKCSCGLNRHEATYYGQSHTDPERCHTLYSMSVKKAGNCNCAAKAWVSFQDIAFINSRTPITPQSVVHRYHFLVEYLIGDNGFLASVSVCPASVDDKHSFCLNSRLSNQCKEIYGEFTELEVMTGLKVIGALD